MTTTTQAAGRVPGAAVGPPSPLPSPEAGPPAGGREILPPATPRADLGPARLGRVTPDRAATGRAPGRLVCRRRGDRGRRMTGDVAVKPPACADRPKTSRTDGGPVRAIAPVPPGEPEAPARARRFPPAAADRPHRFIPE